MDLESQMKLSRRSVVMSNNVFRIVMACPVGTSLGSNVREKTPWEGLVGLLKQLGDDPGNTAIVQTIQAPFMEAVKSWLGSLESVEGARFPTAELQSIVRWLFGETFKREFGEKSLEIELRLLPSKNSVSCATAYMTLYVLRELQSDSFRDKWISNVRIDVKEPEPLDIQVENAELFDESVDRLFQKYGVLRTNKKENEELMINATGGFKAICAFSSIYAQLHDLRCIYTFESNSNTAIELPPLPIGYSLEALDDEISLLKGLDSSELFSDIDAATLPAWLRNLLSREKKGLSSLGKMLLDHYKDRRGSSEAIGSGMLEQLKDSRIRNYLENCIKNPWSQLWLGDQIPETVEHSRRHSKRLMELAGNLYRCAPDELGRIGMKKPEAVALLIAAIYLHDIGHTLMAHPVSEGEREILGGVFPLGNFPSCVREVHHLLSAEVINCRKDELFPKDGIDGEFRKTLMTLVPYIAEHHRGYTTLASSRGVSERCKKTVRSVGELLYGENFGETLRPLEMRLDEEKEREGGLAWNLTPKEVVTVAALLRVLDGCDVQADRVVSPEYMKARLARTKTEGEAIWWELRPLLRGKWENFAGPCGRIYQISRTLDPVEASEGKLRFDSDSGAGPKELETLCKNIYADVTNALLDLKERNGGYLLTPDNYMDFAALSLVNRYAFKWEQFLHFYKHRCVSFVLPVREEGKTLLKIFPDQHFVQQNQDMWSNLENVRKDIENEITYTDGLLETILTPKEVRLV
jgi:hypothetical protein